MAGTVFDKDGARRIVRAVKHVERGIQGSTHSVPRRTPHTLGEERKIPFRMLYADCPAYGIIRGHAASSGNPTTLTCREIDTGTGYLYQRMMVYINGSSEVLRNESGTCSTGEHWPTLARADRDLGAGDIVGPTNNVDDDFRLRAIENDEGWSTSRYNSYYPQRYVIISAGPSDVRPDPDADPAPTYDVYWVRYLGIDHSAPPLIIVPGSTKIVLDSGYTTYGSLKPQDYYGRVSASSLATMMNVTDYGDPCIKFHYTGTWLIGLHVQWHATSCLTPDFDETNTSTADGHYHTYSLWDGANRDVFFRAAMSATAGTIRFGDLEGTQMGYRNGSARVDGTLNAAAMLVTDAGTEATIQAKIDGDGTDSGSTLVIDDWHLWCQWLCPALR